MDDKMKRKIERKRSVSIEMKLSIVIPCYNCEHNIEKVINDFQQALKQYVEWTYEIILVNDCSRDNTIGKLKEIAENYKNVIVINLAKNAGQHSAILAGFRYATGDLVATSDDDGQTPLENIIKLINKVNEGYDVACARYIDRAQPSAVRRLGTAMSRKMTDWLIDKPKDIRLSTFFVAKKFVAKELIKYDQPYPFINGLIARVTSNIANVDMNQNARNSGHSGYNLKKLIRLWLNGFTAFSIKPLRVASLSGILLCLVGFLGAVITIIRKLVDSSVLVGWSSLFSLILVVGGLILCMLGMVGEYVGRIYMCINMTPQYVIKDIIYSNDEKAEEGREN